MSFKYKAGVVGIILVIGGLIALAIGRGCDGGGFGLGSSGGGGNSYVISKGGGGTTAALVVTVDGEQYMVDGNFRTFDEIVSAAAELTQSQSEQSGTQILLKKKGTARFITVQKLEDEFRRRGIRYRVETEN